MLGSRLLGSAILSALLCLPVGCTQADRQARSDHTAKESSEKAETIEEDWPDGQPRLRKEVLRNPDGTLVNHGRYVRWYANGQKEYEAVFVLGRKHGIATRWHKNGCKWVEEVYNHGKKHGVTFVWDENGRKRKEEHHFNGKPHGTWTVWDKDGRIKSQGTFDHGRPKS